MTFMDAVFEKAKTAPRKVVLQEGDDERIIEAGVKATQMGVAQIIMIGTPKIIKEKAAAKSLPLDKINIIDVTNLPSLNEYSGELYNLRKAKGMTEEAATTQMKDPLWYGAMMVRKGLADSFVGGALYTTAEVAKTSIIVVGMKEGIKTLSSFFVMILPDKTFGVDGILFFADGGVVIDPDPNQLADIAIMTAESFRLLMGREPLVAMLSFSTKGSAKHPRVDKVVSAMNIVKQRAPGIVIDGEMQGDSALIAAVGSKKAPGSPVAGKATVLIFPDLDSGNIGYKLTERLAKAEALGPILQGMAKPCSDLSRGCKASDVLNVIAINVVRLQSAQ
jgi:phosphate acetyltransferase